MSFLSPSLSSPAELSLSGGGIAPSPAPPAPAPKPSPAPTPAPAVQHTIQLNWNASTSAVVGYRVYRSESYGTSYTPLTGEAFDGLTYADTSVASGGTYYYVVTAIDAAGVESAHSNQVKAVLPSL